MENLTIVGMHVKPDDVVKELNSVPQLVDFVEKKWNSKVTHFIFYASDKRIMCPEVVYFVPKSSINYRLLLVWRRAVSRGNVGVSSIIVLL